MTRNWKVVEEEVKMTMKPEETVPTSGFIPSSSSTGPRIVPAAMPSAPAAKPAEMQ